MSALNQTDEQLVAALGRQDLSALESLYDRYHKVAYSLAYRILGDTGSAEDVVQDAFLSVWRHAASYQSVRGSARSWLLSIIRNRSIDRLRSSAAEKRAMSTEEAPERDAEAPGIWHQVWSNLRGDLIRTGLDQLPPDQKKSIELAYFSGYTHVEISELMDVPLGTVKGRLRMGLHKLKAFLERPEVGVSIT